MYKIFITRVMKIILLNAWFIFKDILINDSLFCITDILGDIQFLVICNELSASCCGFVQ